LVGDVFSDSLGEYFRRWPDCHAAAALMMLKCYLALMMVLVEKVMVATVVVVGGQARGEELAAGEGILVRQLIGPARVGVVG
jgi:hypothetical protein